MSVLRLFIVAVSSVVLLGCATRQAPVVEGPAAVVMDTARGGGRSGGMFFVLRQFDQTPVPDAWSDSIRASFGQGAHLRVVQVERRVPAGRPVRLTLVAGNDYSAPIQAVWASARDNLHRVGGAVEVTLRPDSRYRVVGILDELRREVWLEEVGGAELPGSRVVGKPSAERLRADASPLGYTCCNLHYNEGERWASDANWFYEPFLPAGTPIRVYEYGTDRAKAMVAEEPLWLGLDYARKRISVQDHVTRLVVPVDPTARIDQWPPEVRHAIRDGKARVGMTREQALVALGYPRADLTPSLDVPRWHYGEPGNMEFQVLWTADHRIERIDAVPDILAQVLAAP